MPPQALDLEDISREEMQGRAADGERVDADDGIAGVLQVGQGHVGPVKCPEQSLTSVLNMGKQPSGCAGSGWVDTAAGHAAERQLQDEGPPAFRPGM